MSHPRRHAFSLTELLLVIGLIGVLLAILLPALAASRRGAQAAACGSNLRQIGLGVGSYAADNRQHIPRGPEGAGQIDPYVGVIYAYAATSQVWIGALQRYDAHGALIDSAYLGEKRSVFCPADDTADPTEELAKIGTTEDAFSSYLFRQLDELSKPAGRLHDLGVNGDGNEATLLALDRQTQIPAIPNGVRSNHENRLVNLLYFDGRVVSRPHESNQLAVTSPMGFEARLNEILRNGDHLYDGEPVDLPYP